MVAYSFQPQFVDPILSGRKYQTIRAPRRRHARTGETLQLYTGQRTRACRLIGRALCASVDPIALDLSPHAPRVTIGRFALRDRPQLDAFAELDGFADWTALVSFWGRHHDPALTQFEGVLIRWSDFEGVQ